MLNCSTVNSVCLLLIKHSSCSSVYRGHGSHFILTFIHLQDKKKKERKTKKNTIHPHSKRVMFPAPGSTCGCLAAMFYRGFPVSFLPSFRLIRVLLPPCGGLLPLSCFSFIHPMSSLFPLGGGFLPAYCTFLLSTSSQWTSASSTLLSTRTLFLFSCFIHPICSLFPLGLPFLLSFWAALYLLRSFPNSFLSSFYLMSTSCLWKFPNYFLYTSLFLLSIPSFPFPSFYFLLEISCPLLTSWLHSTSSS